MTWYHLVVFVHIMSAVLWVGGIFFLALVAVPALRRQSPELRSELLARIGNRFRTIGYSLLIILTVTGVIQAYTHGATFANITDGTFFRSHFGSALATKIFFFIIMVAVSAVHDFYVGPASVRALKSGRDIASLRKAANWLARLTALLAVAVVAYAVIMLR